MLSGVPRATVSLQTLTHNLGALRSRLRPETDILVPVKADAYGHGVVATAKYLENEGVLWFGVATAGEALELRAEGVSSNIVIFTPVYNGLEDLIAQDVALSVVDLQSAEAVIRAASGQKARVHLKVDTGMGRLGEGTEASLATAKRLACARNVELEGLWTHFACSDEPDRSYTETQLGNFHDAVSALEREGLEVPLKHTANSAATLAYPESHFDLVRPGIAVYGYHSSPHSAALAPELTPAMTLTAPVTFVKKVEKGQSLSYGALWTAPEDTTIATVRFGYADGYPRVLSTHPAAQVRLHGRRCPIVGRVCMDQLLVDVGELDVQVDDRVVLFAPEGPTAEELGEAAGTISYELLVRLGARVTREYV
ncbi:MAG: Alanine racemase [uncultured Truepera sp.]|uniref:Alanine racemase n=1 Tax=uncultured Truepera sp. TaxID=543023 RepID=A0A6J4V516_9DEIN|nr:MAG: Alanine racemase [uncultured Truepera sp.]